MKLSTLLLLVLVVVAASSVATTSETETETATTASAATEEVEGSCKATYDSDGNIVEGSDCDATTGGDDDEDDDGDDDEDDVDDKPDFSKYDCNDMNKDCGLWAGQGECDANPKVSGTCAVVYFSALNCTGTYLDRLYVRSGAQEIKSLFWLFSSCLKKTFLVAFHCNFFSFLTLKIPKTVHAPVLPTEL